MSATNQRNRLTPTPIYAIIDGCFYYGECDGTVPLDGEISSAEDR